MRSLYVPICLTFALVFGSAVTALAKIPKEVMTPYKAYTAAQKDGNEKAIYDNALKAWEAAEEHLGDHKTTGDLANNFAELYALGKNPLKNYKTRLKARERSVELASFYPEVEIAAVELERHIKLVSLSLVLSRQKQGDGGKGQYFNDVERAIETHGMQGSTFEGDLETLRAKFYNMRKDYQRSVDHAQKALQIFETRTDDFTSVYPFIARRTKGDSLKAMDKPILAALEYQHVMQNLEGEIPSDHPFVETAFKSWLTTRSGLEEAGRLDEAEQAGLCECWPFEDYKNKVVPLKRTPPPKSPAVFNKGKHSGHVFVLFDVDDSGSTYNIKNDVLYS